MTELADRFAYTSATDRRDRLAAFVLEQGYCTTTELSTRFAVSEMTIRRDVAKLVANGRLRAFHGGVGSVSPADVSGSDYGLRDLRMAGAKRAVAERALRHIEPRTVVGLDAGTTAAQLAALLPTDAHLKVVTPSLPVVTALVGNPGIDLITCLGGDLHAESLSFAGSATLAAIANLHIDTLFLAASGLNERGAFCGNSFDAITKRALIEVADRVVLIADSSKFSTSAMVRICSWEPIDTFVVDDGLTAADQALVQQAGTAVDAAPIGLLLDGPA